MLKDSKIWIYLLIAIAFSSATTLQLTAAALGITYMVHLFLVSSSTIAFREFTLVMYSLNYLLSPSILYNFNDSDILPYRMNVEPDEYFSIAIPGILALHAGIYMFKTEIFSTRFSFVKIQAVLNEDAMKTWLLGGLGLKIANDILPIPGEIAFFILLLSGLRYVGLFGLLTLNPSKYKYYIGAVVAYEFFWALQFAFFHDLMIWIIFFGLYYIFLKKMHIAKKVLLGFIFIIFAYLLQNFKGEYRNQLYNDEVGDYSVAITGAVNSETFRDNDALFSEEKIASNLVRVNQAWIAASTIDNMNRT
ncbi:MAG: hypothetical protein NTZ59_11805, partial [Bacteroidetes bacterium]|nr:hypothetical protein [Bacteroidota bacterium]